MERDGSDLRRSPAPPPPSPPRSRGFHPRPFALRAPLSHPPVRASFPKSGSGGLLRGRRWLFVAVRAGDVSFPCEHIRPFLLSSPPPLAAVCLFLPWTVAYYRYGGAFSSVNVNPRRHLLIQINHNRGSLNHPFTPRLCVVSNDGPEQTGASIFNHSFLVRCIIL